MHRSSLILAVLAAAASLAVGTPARSATTHTSDRAATVGTAASSLGRILVDSRGHTLYLFEKDTRARSACSGACAALLAAAPHQRQAGRRPGREAVPARHDPPERRNEAGHLRRPSALPVRAGHQAWPDQRPGLEDSRRRLVRAHAGWHEDRPR